MWNSAGSAPSLRVLPWHLPFKANARVIKKRKSTEKPKSGEEKPQSGYSIHITKTPTHYNTPRRIVKSLREVTDEEEIFENFTSNQTKRFFLKSPSLGENRIK